MPSIDRPPACIDCDWTGMRLVLVITDKARTMYAAPCDCARGRAISHPMVSDAKIPSPPAFDAFADQQRRKGHQVIVTDRHEPRIALRDSDPEAWERAQGELERQPENPYRRLVDAFPYAEAVVDALDGEGRL